MYRTVLVTKDGVSVNHHDWDQTPVVRLSWDLPGETVISLPMLPDDTALRVSVADLRSWALQREAAQLTRNARSARVTNGLQGQPARTDGQ